MMLTGNCKKDFERWYRFDSKIKYIPYSMDDKRHGSHVDFYDLPFSMQFGVYIDFFDSVGMIIDIHPVLNYDHEKYTDVHEFVVYVRRLNEVEDNDDIEVSTRQEAREIAIEKANKKYNK